MPSSDGEDSDKLRKLRSNLAFGRRQLNAKFQSSPGRTFSSGKGLVTSAGPSGAIFHIRTGWACQFHSLANNRRAIVDIYQPGDVVALDAVLRIRPSEEVLTLTSVTAEVIYEEHALSDLMACPQTALYIAWLVGQRQRRADQLLAAVLCLDARGRLATMLLDFYTRLRRRRLVTGSTYNLPLTQSQIGGYLGLTVVHVNRTLRSLRDDRVVEVEKHCVTILDLDRLMWLAHHRRPEDPVTHIGERSSNEIALHSSEAAD
jgi:CRP-like cAMP-binding protein